jgi:hypothetical protein
MLIHFICRGNSFRSIIAEAYLNSLRIKGLRILSSGTAAASDKAKNLAYYAGIHLDCDGDTRTLGVVLIRLDDNELPERWWERQIPSVALSLRAVADALAPQSLTGETGLPPIEREADRAPHLRFWASVLQNVAADWLQGDRTWFDKVEGRLRGDGPPT